MILLNVKISRFLNLMVTIKIYFRKAREAQRLSCGRGEGGGIDDTVTSSSRDGADGRAGPGHSSVRDQRFRTDSQGALRGQEGNNGLRCHS